MQEVMLF